ncbi:Peroxisomal dehydratase [Mycena chlorophos]|uniref:Peroxisomal dehydratase n=1 Tax=Mycena chlorophos TaxID=658473 RepID=A0A8H6SV74_MYCCL|nr:Peroxisomal dehydratase [Mycena chlorophos]
MASDLNIVMWDANTGSVRQPRTKFEQWQYDILEDVFFELTMYPDAALVRDLSERLHAPKKSVRIWFQNKRMIVKPFLVPGTLMERHLRMRITRCVKDDITSGTRPSYGLSSCVAISPQTLNKRDLLTYAAGRRSESQQPEHRLRFSSCVPSGAADPSFAALPTYPVVLPFKGDSQELNNFAETMFGNAAEVHGFQSIEILKDIPLVSGPGWTWTTKYVGIAENKTGIVLTAENTLLDPSGAPYAKLYSTSFNLGAKARGSPFAKTSATPPQGQAHPQGPSGRLHLHGQNHARDPLVSAPPPATNCLHGHAFPRWLPCLVPVLFDLRSQLRQILG